MPPSRPAGIVSWRDREVWIYVSPELAPDADKLVAEIAKKLPECKSVRDVRKNVGLVLQVLGISVFGSAPLKVDNVSFIDRPDHADPFGQRISIGISGRWGRAPREIWDPLGGSIELD